MITNLIPAQILLLRQAREQLINVITYVSARDPEYKELNIIIEKIERLIGIQ